MIIDFERSGGYANLRLRYRANTDELPLGVANDLRQLVDRSGILSLKPADLAPPSHDPPGAMRYRVAISQEGAVHSVELSDITVPPALRPLLTRLQELALEQKR
jgi:hypothetical protein